MNQEDIIGAIYDVLKNKMSIPHISAFSETARLNEDLYLDSVMVLQLILHLELDYGFDFPDDALLKKDFNTVGNLAKLLGKLQNVR